MSGLWILTASKERYIESSKKCRPYDIYKAIDSTQFEMVHTRFIKCTLGVHRATSSNSARMEVGAHLNSHPLENCIKLQSLKNWTSTMSMENSLVKEALDPANNLHNKNIYSWSTYIKNIMSSIDITAELPEACPPLSKQGFQIKLTTHYNNISITALNSQFGHRPGESN